MSDLKNTCPIVKYTLDSNEAVVPKRETEFSIGRDLTAIGVWKTYGKTTLYETGLAIEPPNGYYIEIFPRSSLSKTGYMLANSIGLIDPDYRGTLKIALMKIDDSMPDLELPFTKCQIVLRKCEYYNMEESERLSETVRGDGGFGSTDKLN